MTSKEIADELQAEEFLLNKGYTKAACNVCDGKGFSQSTTGRFWNCSFCDARGWNWIGPILKIDNEPS